MPEIDWTPWKSGTLDPKIMLNNEANFESRRILGQWEYRLGTVRPPVIDHIHLYGQTLELFSPACDDTSVWNIVIETEDSVPNGNIVIKRLN